MRRNGSWARGWAGKPGITAAAVCGALLTAALVVGHAVDGPDAAVAGSGKRVIVSPKPGERLPARAMTIRVRVGKHAKHFRAQLNGHPLTGHFKRSHHGVRSVRVSASYGLRHGRNALHVTVKRRRTGKHSEWSHFRVKRNRPLAGAGRDMVLTRGQKLYLNGGNSRSHKARARGLRHRWSLVDAPRGSALDARSTRGVSSTDVEPDIDGEDSQAGVIEPDVPGEYQVGLNVTATDGTRGQDTMAVNVVNPPMVQIDTMNEASDRFNPGIRVGADHYPVDPFSASSPTHVPWFQMVVLDRKTLKPVSNNSNTTYYCNSASGGACAVNDLQRDLGKLDKSNLVIVANHLFPRTWAAPGNVSFEKIGVPAQAVTNNPGASVSAIGVPEAKSGQATWHVDPAGGTAGQITGSLILGQTGDVLQKAESYTYLAPRVKFDTQVVDPHADPNTNSNANQNVMQVGAHRFTHSLDLDPNQNGAGGFHVVVLDRRNLERDPQNLWFPTGLQNFDSGEAGRLNDMASALQRANESNKLVIIASRGNPATQGGREDQQQNVNNAVQHLVDQIEKLGGTRTAAFNALAPGVKNAASAYTLIGWSGATAAKGVEAHGKGAAASRALNTAALRGTFAPGSDFTMEVGDTAPSKVRSASDPVPHIAGEKLNDALVQDPQAWPGTPGQQAAIAYIGQQAFNGHDVRTAYWDLGQDNFFWETKRDRVIDTVPYPGGNPGFTTDELAAAKTELKQEIDWLLSVRGLTTRIAEPITRGDGKEWAYLGASAAAINTGVAVNSSKQDKARAIVGAIFEHAREAAGDLPVVGDAVGVVNSIYDTAMEIATIATDDLASVDEPFEVTAGEFGVTMSDRLERAHDTITVQMTNAIVADYGKLKQVGACNQLDASHCVGNPDLWIFDDKKDRPAAESAMKIGIQVANYAALTPARWNLWQLSSSCTGARDYTCWEDNFKEQSYRATYLLQHYCPFMDLGQSARLIRPLYRDIPSYSNASGFGSDHNDVWQTYALANITGSGDYPSVYKSEVAGDFLKDLFKPISQGGLGVEREEFFMGNFTSKLIGRGGHGYPYGSPRYEPEWAGPATNCIRP